jgi:predicted metal-dependent phosphoesterase TrpH
VPRALELSAKTGIKTLPALELSTIDENRMVHILGYGVSLDGKSELSQLIDRIQKSRYEILPKIKSNLENFGFFVDMDRVHELAAPNAPVITNFANAVVENEKNRNHPEMWKYLPGGPKSKNPYISFIKDYLVAGTIGYVPEYIVDIYTGISAITKSGGVPVLAHPGEWFKYEDEAKLPKMIECGLKGMEVYTPYHTPEKESYFKHLTEENHLIVTAGSDFHSEERKPGHLIGGISHADMGFFGLLEKNCQR